LGIVKNHQIVPKSISNEPCGVRRQQYSTCTSQPDPSGHSTTSSLDSYDLSGQLSGSGHCASTLPLANNARIIALSANVNNLLISPSDDALRDAFDGATLPALITSRLSFTNDFLMVKSPLEINTSHKYTKKITKQHHDIFFMATFLFSRNFFTHTNTSNKKSEPITK
jgi:hypothetical protein